MSNEVVRLDDLFILNCLVKNEPIALGRFIQWRLWLVSDSVVGAICIGGIITRLAQFFGVDVSKIPSIKPISLGEAFIQNSKQFTLMNKKWL